MMRSTDALRPWQPYRSYPVRMFTRMVLRNCANLRSYILEFWLATSCRSLILLSVICDNSLDISCIFLLSKFYQMRHNSWTTLSFKQQSIITSEMCQRRFEFLWMIGLHSFAKKHHLKIADTCTMHSPISVLCRKIGPHGKSVSCSLSIRSSIEMNEVASKLKVLRFFSVYMFKKSAAKWYDKIAFACRKSHQISWSMCGYNEEKQQKHRDIW